MGVKTVSHVTLELGGCPETFLARLREHNTGAQPHDKIQTVALGVKMRSFKVVALLKQAAK
jgi:hypothetical protein